MENTEELQDFLRDLSNWEKDMKRKDEELRMKPNDTKKLPGIRKQSKKSKNEKVESSELKSVSNLPPEIGNELPIENKQENCSQEGRISSYDYASWDSFDVEKALEKVDAQPTKVDLKESSSDDEEEEEIIQNQKKQQALFEKDRGNRFFSEGKYDDAIACYTSGVLADPTNAVLPANRAMALLKKGQLAAAEQDCTLSISLDCTYAKAFHRRGTCRFALKKFQLARQDFLKVIELEPGNKFAQAELGKLEQEFRKMDKPRTETGPTVPNIPNTDSSLLEGTESVSSATRDSNLLFKDTQSDLMEKREKPSVFYDLPHQIRSVCKPAQLKSKKPLQRLTIEITSSDEEEDSIVIPSPALRPTDLLISKPCSSGSTSLNHTPTPTSFSPSTPRSLPSTPHTSFQFETDWRRLRHWPHLMTQYLKQVTPENLSRMYQQSMETEIFLGILHCLKEISLSDQKAAYLYLKHLTKVGRFGTIVMFMTDEESQIIKDVLDAVPAESSQEIDNLKTLYSL